MNVYNLNISSGKREYFTINVETKYQKGQEFCLYDIDCKLQNNLGRNLKKPQIGFQSTSSEFYPIDRMKTISMDEYGRDMNRYKIKSENEIDLDDFQSFAYGSSIQYQCGDGKSFEMNKNESNTILGQQDPNLSSADNIIVRNFNVSCQWDGNWSVREFTVPNCVCKLLKLKLVNLNYLK